ncbi:hypothetical protein, partial [uncultured Allobaculum sp.]|uniref:hypothetical protein n=1 Tax=uncultured Allobaculum sp. TaxID=1187017 RepID=UPI00259B212F
MEGTDRMQHCAGKTACKSKWFYFSKKMLIKLKKYKIRNFLKEYINAVHLSFTSSLTNQVSS